MQSSKKKACIGISRMYAKKNSDFYSTSLCELTDDKTISCNVFSNFMFFSKAIIRCRTNQARFYHRLIFFKLSFHSKDILRHIRARKLQVVAKELIRIRKTGRMNKFLNNPNNDV